MKQFQYTVSAKLEDETKCTIVNEGTNVGYVQRIYSNRIKQKLDHLFDYRYFLTYESLVFNEKFSVKKVARRGKLWYEGKFEYSDEKIIIMYENWRVGIPELKILVNKDVIRIEKHNDAPSCFYENDQCIATWNASFEEENQSFIIDVIIEEGATIQSPAFYIAIGQAVLFIGA